MHAFKSSNQLYKCCILTEAFLFFVNVEIFETFVYMSHFYVHIITHNKLQFFQDKIGMQILQGFQYKQGRNNFKVTYLALILADEM